MIASFVISLREIVVIHADRSVAQKTLLDKLINSVLSDKAGK